MGSVSVRESENTTTRDMPGSRRLHRDHSPGTSPGYVSRILWTKESHERSVPLHGGSCWNGELALETQQDGWNPLNRMGGIHSAGWVESTQHDGWNPLSRMGGIHSAGWVDFCNWNLTEGTLTRLS